jgi:hypothetical protein
VNACYILGHWADKHTVSDKHTNSHTHRAPNKHTTRKYPLHWMNLKQSEHISKVWLLVSYCQVIQVIRRTHGWLQRSNREDLHTQIYTGSLSLSLSPSLSLSLSLSPSLFLSLCLFLSHTHQRPVQTVLGGPTHTHLLSVPRSEFVSCFCFRSLCFCSVPFHWVSLPCVFYLLLLLFLQSTEIW